MQRRETRTTRKDKRLIIARSNDLIRKEVMDKKR